MESKSDPKDGEDFIGNPQEKKTAFDDDHFEDQPPGGP